MRTLPLLIAVTLVTAITFPVTTHAYADRRTYKFGEGKRVIHRYEIEGAEVLPEAVPSYHCVYFATDGRCISVAKHYNNVRSTRVRSHMKYLNVTPSTVSPRAADRPQVYVQPLRSSGQRYVEYVPVRRNSYR